MLHLLSRESQENPGPARPRELKFFHLTSDLFNLRTLA
jgi:hypothetical protein